MPANERISDAYENVARQSVDLLCNLLDKDVTLEEAQNLGNILIGKFNRLQRLSEGGRDNATADDKSSPGLDLALATLKRIAEQDIPTPKYYCEPEVILHERDAMVHMAKDALAKIEVPPPSRS